MTFFRFFKWDLSGWKSILSRRPRASLQLSRVRTIENLSLRSISRHVGSSSARNFWFRKNSPTARLFRSRSQYRPQDTEFPMAELWDSSSLSFGLDEDVRKVSSPVHLMNWRPDHQLFSDLDLGWMFCFTSMRPQSFFGPNRGGWVERSPKDKGFRGKFPGRFAKGSTVFSPGWFP